MKRVHIRLDVTEEERNSIRRAAALGGFRSMAEFARTTITERGALMEEWATLKPEGLTDAHLEYLDILRESGANMFGGAEYLANYFGLDILAARTYLAYWMRTSSDRNVAR